MGYVFFLLWNCGFAPIAYIGLGWFTKIFVTKLERFLPLMVVLFLCTLALSTIPGLFFPKMVLIAGSSDWFAKLYLCSSFIGFIFYFYGKTEAQHDDYEVRPMESQSWEAIPSSV